MSKPETKTDIIDEIQRKVAKLEELVNDSKSQLEWHKSRVEEFEIKHELYLREYNYLLEI